MRGALLLALLAGCESTADAPDHDADADTPVADATADIDAGPPPPDAAPVCPAIAPAGPAGCAAPPPPMPPPPGWVCPEGWSRPAAGVGCVPNAPPPVPDPEAGCADPWPPEGIGAAWYVDPTAEPEAADGSAGRPFPTLEGALDAAGAMANRAPDTLLLAPGEYVGGLLIDVPDLDLIGPCPAQVTIRGGLRLSDGPRRLAGLTVAADDGPALAIAPRPDDGLEAPTVRIERIEVRGAAWLANRVSADELAVITPAGAAVILDGGERTALRCDGCRLESSGGPALDVVPADAQVDFSGLLIGGIAPTDASPGAPAVQSAGHLRFVDVEVRAAGATAIALTGAIEAERLAVSALAAGGAPNAAVLVFEPAVQANLLALEDVSIEVPAGGIGAFVCCRQNARFARWTVLGAGDAESVGLVLHETHTVIEDIALVALGKGAQLRATDGTLERAVLRDLATEGVLQATLEGSELRPFGIDIVDLVADGLGGTAVRVSGAPSRALERRDLDETGIIRPVIGVLAPVARGVVVEAGGLARLSGATFGPHTRSAVVVDGGDLRIREMVAHGATRGLVSLQGGVIQAEDLVIQGADEALVADDARLSVSRGLVADSVVAVVRRLAAAVTLKDVTFRDNHARDRCELVCTDRPPNRGAPLPLPEEE